MAIKKRRFFIVAMFLFLFMGVSLSQERVLKAQSTAVTDAIAKVQETRDAISVLDPTDKSIFRNNQDYLDLLATLDNVITNIQNGTHNIALDLLQTDLLVKVDGCDLTGTPDNGDKIRDCNAQGLVFPLVVESIVMVETIGFSANSTVMLQDTSPGTPQDGNINISGNLEAAGGVGINGSAVIDSNGKWVGDPTGLVGPTGPVGVAGADGATGSQGPQGPTGADGATGPAGADGINGTDGTNGATGSTGPQGPAGADGADGTTGPAGADGAAGLSIQGPQGDPGTSRWIDGFETVSTTGSVQIGNDTAACTNANAGTIRWTGSILQLCDGAMWQDIFHAGFGSDGTTPTSAGLSCQQIKDDGHSTGNDLYWVDPNGGDTSDAFQVYCDMTIDGGGWQLCVKGNDWNDTMPSRATAVWGASPVTPTSSLGSADCSRLVHSLNKVRISSTNLVKRVVFGDIYYDTDGTVEDLVNYNVELYEMGVGHCTTQAAGHGGGNLVAVHYQPDYPNCCTGAFESLSCAWSNNGIWGSSCPVAPGCFYAYDSFWHFGCTFTSDTCTIPGPGLIWVK